MAAASFLELLIIQLCLVLGTLTSIALSQEGCGGSCTTLSDCAGQLICINGQCNDDPDVGTHTCSGQPSSPGSGGGGGGSCSATPGNADNSCCASNTCQETSCSPPVSSTTAAILTVNNFQPGGDGGDPSACDQQYHSDTEMIVALSTGWFDNQGRCLKSIVINGNGKTATATVVDECDSLHGCDAQHADQAPCANNIVDASNAVWQALGVSQGDSQYGYMDITWADATS